MGRPTPISTPPPYITLGTANWTFIVIFNVKEHSILVSWGIYFQTQTAAVSFLDFQASIVATLDLWEKPVSGHYFLFCF